MKKPPLADKKPAGTGSKVGDKPATSITFGDKKKPGNVAQGSDEADPIDDSLKERIKAGGVTQVVASDKKAGAGSKPVTTGKTTT